MRLIFKIIFFGLLGTAVFAQNKIVRCDYFGTEKGLNVTNINDLLQDREGFLWLATREGLVRFDGYTFKYFRRVEGDSTSIFSNHIIRLMEDAQGNIWCGLVRGGVSKYDRRTGKFRNYNFTERLKTKTASISSLFTDREGRVWLSASLSGLLLLDEQTGDFREFEVVTRANAPHLSELELPNSKSVYDCWQEESGKIWLATNDDIRCFDPATGRVEVHRSLQPIAGQWVPFGAYCLYADGDLLWVGGWSSGLRRFNRKTGEWKQFFWNTTHAHLDAVNVVSSILPNGEDELWLASADGGLMSFNKKTEQFFFFSRDKDRYPDLPISLPGHLIQDKQGNLWTNVESDLARIQVKDNKFTLHPVEQTQPIGKDYNFPSVIFEDREGRFRFVGLADGDGVQVFDKRTGKIHVPKMRAQFGRKQDDFAVPDIKQTRDGSIWVLGRHLIYRFNPQTMQLDLPQPQPPLFATQHKSNWYNQLTEDLNGNLWLCTAGFGTFRWNPRTGECQIFEPKDGDPNSVPTLVAGSVAADRRGRIWFGSRNYTAYGYFLPSKNGEPNRFVRLDAAGKPTPELASMRLNSFFTDPNGNIWACSEQGLLHFDCADDEPRLLKKYTTTDGLPTDFIVWGVATTDGKAVWCHLDGFDALTHLDLATGKITNFFQSDGLPEVSHGIGQMLDGQLFTRCPDGFLTFDAAALAPMRSRVPLALTSFQVDGIERHLCSQRVPPEPLIVPADSRYFSLEFAALDLSAPDLCEYEYLFEGFDNQWVKTGKRRFFSFTHVPAGRYFFKIKLAGAPDSEAIVVPLRVEVSFYKTGWFWALVAALIAGAVFRFFQIRQRQRQQVRDLESKTQLLEKEKAVVMYESLKQQLNPHFLFNSLTSLGSLIQIAPKSAVGFLENLSKTYRYILKSSERETVPLGEELKFAESFVNLQKTRFETGFEVKFEVSEDFFHRKIVPVTLQNLIENAMKHNIIDDESPLVVEVFVADDCLVVRNNLQRKKFVETSNRKGLANLQSFYRYLSDRPILTSEEGGFFTISIPLV